MISKYVVYYLEVGILDNKKIRYKRAVLSFIKMFDVTWSSRVLVKLYACIGLTKGPSIAASEGAHVP